MKMDKTRLLFIGVLMAAGITSCTPEQVDVDQNRVYPSYKLSYNKSENKTTAQASFSLDSLNGTTYQLKNPATVTYADETLIFSVNDDFYSKEFVNVKTGEFKYTNNDLNEFVNSISIPDSLSVFNLPAAHPIDLDLIVSIETTALAEDEIIELQFTDLQSELSVTAYADSISSGNLLIDANFLTGLGTGEVEIIFRRVKTTTNLSQANSVGGQIITTYELQDTVVLF